MAGEPANVGCILIADDLTGACDAGVQFVRRGVSCRVEMSLSEHRAPTTTDVLAFNTNSRNDSPEDCRRKIEALGIRCSHLRPNFIFKKVDSTLRGNVGDEIATALRTFQCEAAIIAPAFPAMCRLVRHGTIEWSDCSGRGQIEIGRELARQGVSRDKFALLRPSVELANSVSELSQHLMNGQHWVIVDCESQNDLQLTAAAGTQIPGRLLWVGSAGLAVALADHLAKLDSHRSDPALSNAPVLFVIGSTHPATLRQKEVLLATLAAVEVEASPETIDAARHALGSGRHLLVSVPRGSLTEFCLHQFLAGLEGVSLAAMFLTGGDTGTSVCNALGASSIDLRDEIVPGFPWGVFVDGIFHALPVASKSGAFGDKDALVRCARFFTAARDS